MDFQNLTHEELFEVMAGAASPGYYQMAVEELQRRFLENVRVEVKHLHGSSIRLEWLTGALIFLTVILAGSEVHKWLAKGATSAPTGQHVSPPPLTKEDASPAPSGAQQRG